MPQMADLRKAIIARLSPVPGINSRYWYDPRNIEAPGVFVMPSQPFADYEKVPNEWFFTVVVAVEDAGDEEAAQEELDAFMSTGPGALLVPLLRDEPEEIDDALRAMTRGVVWVTQGGDYQPLVKDFTRYQTAQLRVRLCASRA